MHATRPAHTVFIPSPFPLRDLKAWTSHTLTPSGSVIIDRGAHLVLSRRESGGRLLPAGVVGVEGTFASGQAVRIIVRRRKGRADDIGTGVRTVESASFTSTVETTATTMTTTATSSSTRVHFTYLDDSPTLTEPSTPTLLPTASMTSSIASLTPLNSMTSSLIVADNDRTPSQTMPTWELLEEGLASDDKTIESGRRPAHDMSSGDDSEWELQEVGRGLANYNSAQLEKVKGLKRYVV